jgi:Domain of unknown function (DUF4153)
MWSNDAAVRDHPPAPPDVDVDPGSGTWSLVAITAAFGLFTDAVIDGPPGLGLTLGAIAAATALTLVTHPRRVAIPFIVSALAISGFLVVRASPVLEIVDVLATAALLIAGATFASSGEPAKTTVRGYVSRAVVAPVAAIPHAVASLTGPPARLTRPGGRWLRPALRAVAWTSPIVVVLVLLFGSADPVFARYAGTPLRLTPDAWPAHVIEVGAGAFVLAVLLAVPARSPAVAGVVRSGAPISVPLRTSVEWKVPLIATAIVFGGFVAVQFTVFFGGRTHVLEQQGLTFAAYARSGFWQLLAAAAIAAAVIAAAWSALPEPPSTRDRRTFAALSVTVIALVMVVLVSAFRRLALYEQAFGFTWPRLLGHIAVVVLAALLVCGVIAVVTGRAAWLPTAALIVAVVVTLGVNAIDPERFMAERNLARGSTGASLDVGELGGLSADAIPPIVEALPSLPRDVRVSVERRLACARDELRDAAGHGWASYDVSRARASTLLGGLALGPCTLHEPSV